MLFTLAWLAGRKYKEKLAFFLWTFAFWDIFYYFWLYVLIKWPPSILTPDVLFLIPCPWIAPVILPVGISVLMIGTAIWLLKIITQSVALVFIKKINIIEGIRYVLCIFY